MIGYKVNGRFLDLVPGSSGEIERKSPLFSVSDLTSEVSTPQRFPYTANNALALELPYQYYSARQKKKFQAEYYDGNRYRGKCTLVIETGKLNLNNIEATEISGYVLYGISNFFQDIKGKKLKDLKLGGVRTFNYTTNNPDDGSAGYWQHFHATWTDNTIPYVFQPIRNEAYFGENGDADWMNKLNDQAKLLFDYNSPIVPIIRVKYLLEQIFSEIGYAVNFSGLNDTDWEKLILVNLVKLQWVTPQPVTGTDGNTVIEAAPKSVLEIDLSKHVPQDKLISDFIIQLYWKYGWAPLFDPLRRVCRFVAVKEVGEGPVKDWTMYAEPEADSNFNEDAKIFAFTNEIDPNDSFPSQPDLANLNIGLPATYARYLPTPTSAEEGLVRFCYYDNQWWQVQLDETSNLFEWKVLADNIYNDEPIGNTDTIASTISTLPCYYTDYRTEAGIAYSGYFPMMKQEASKTIGYRTLLYHGMVQELAYNGTGTGVRLLYPHASDTREDPLGINPLTWSNVYRHAKFAGTNYELDFGIRKYWWSKFLDVLQAGEEDIFKINLPLHELIRFAWDDKILIANTPYLVKSLIEPVPYTGYIQATLKRLTKPASVVITDAGTGSVVSGVYAKLTVTEINDHEFFGIHTHYSNVIIHLYSDALGTIPYTPAAALYVSVQCDFVNNSTGAPSNTTNAYYEVRASVQTIIANTRTKINTYTEIYNETMYSLYAPGAFGYQVI